MSTYRVARQLHHIDGRGMVVGRLSVNVARLLQGKHKPTYEPWADCGDEVVVTNATRVVFTGKKWQQKVYRYHTGWVGGLKEVPVQRVLERKPHQIIEHAVFGMLPRNKLRRLRMERLHVIGEESIPEVLMERMRRQGDLPPHLAAQIEREALWREEVFDPKIHRGYTLEIKEDADSWELIEGSAEGKKKPRNRRIKAPRMFKPETVYSHTWDREEWDALVAEGLSPEEIRARLERKVDPAEFRAKRRWLT
jgi:large subunit ribosomal protein L13